jgi:hypothetical protein
MNFTSAIAALANSDGMVVEEAAVELEKEVQRGRQRAQIVQVLKERVATYPPLGRAKALEILGAADDPSAANALLPLVDDSDETTQWMAIDLVARWGYAPALPSLLELRGRLYRERIPPDYMVPTALRDALLVLGEREQVAAPSLSSFEKAFDTRSRMWGWRVPEPRALLDDFSAANQAVLMVAPWRLGTDGYFYGVRFSPIRRPEYDWLYHANIAWTEKIHRLLEDRAQELSQIPNGDDIYLALTWIAESDVGPF